MQILNKKIFFIILLFSNQTFFKITQRLKKITKNPAVLVGVAGVASVGILANALDSHKNVLEKHKSESFKKNSLLETKSEQINALKLKIEELEKKAENPKVKEVEKKVNSPSKVCYYKSSEDQKIIGDLKNALARLISERAEIIATNNRDFETQQKRLKEKHESLVASENENKELSEKISNLERGIAAFKEDRENALVSQEELTKTLSNEAIAKRELNDKILNLNEQLENLKRSAEKNANLQNQIDELQYQLTQLHSTKTESSSQAVQTASVEFDNKDVQADLESDDLKNQIKKMEDEKADLEQTLERRETEAKAAKEGYAKSIAQLSKTTSEACKVNREVFQSEIEKLNADLIVEKESSARALLEKNEVCKRGAIVDAEAAKKLDIVNLMNEMKVKKLENKIQQINLENSESAKRDEIQRSEFCGRLDIESKQNENKIKNLKAEKKELELSLQRHKTEAEVAKEANAKLNADLIVEKENSARAVLEKEEDYKPEAIAGDDLKMHSCRENINRIRGFGITETQERAKIKSEEGESFAQCQHLEKNSQKKIANPNRRVKGVLNFDNSEPG